MHESTILTDLAWIMVGAAIAALIFQRIKLPPLLGYLAAGFLLGPNLGVWPAVVHIDNVAELSELGVIFLMFYIGLEFNFDRLKVVFAPAFLALALQTLCMLFIGMEASRWLGMSQMDGWFLGGLLSISSSMVSVKLMREKGIFRKPQGQMAVGILVFEDILAILLLVLLNGMAAKGSLDWYALGRSALLIGIFAVAIFLIGKLSAPRLMRALQKSDTTEIITLSTLGLTFAVSLIADRFEFSWALGGFLAGAILSRTALAHRIDHLTEPLRDLFSALFFVSVGMLIEPIGLWENAGAILILSAIVVSGKFLSCWTGLFLSGQPAREAGQSSLIKSQIGEFSFVITAIGAKYAVTSPDLQSIASGVAFVTILLTPALIGRSDSILNTIGKVIPNSAKDFADLYSRWQNTIRLSANGSGFFKLARRPIIRIGIHFLLINAVIIAAALISDSVSAPGFLPIGHSHFQQLVFLLSLLISVPFLVDTVRHLNVIVLLFSDTALSRPVFQQFSKGAYRSVFNGLILVLLMFVYGSLFIVVAAPYFPTGSVFLAFVVLTVLVGSIFWKRIVRMHYSWEMAFIESMRHDTEERISERIANSLQKLNSKRPWNVKVESITLAQDSKWAGCQIGETHLRKKTGTTIAGIERGGFEVTGIRPETRLYPNDVIYMLGEQESLSKATAFLMETDANAAIASIACNFSFTKIIVPPLCPYVGVSLRDTDIRKEHNVTIVGIQRGDTRIVSPDPKEKIEEEDMLLAMGSDENLQRFQEQMRNANRLERAQV